MTGETRDRLKPREYFDKKISGYEAYMSDEGTETHMQFMTARFSRGDDLGELRLFFPEVIRSVQLDDALAKMHYGEHEKKLHHKGKYAGLYRSSLVLLTWALCLRAEQASVEALLALLERGEALMECIIARLAPGCELAAKRMYPKAYDGLYAVLDAPPAERAALVGEYLKVWYSKKMKGFSFKDTHKDDNSGYVGYWCFEAAGVVAALDIDDASFRDHPHYPKDLVAYYRAHG